MDTKEEECEKCEAAELSQETDNVKCEAAELSQGTDNAKCEAAELSQETDNATLLQEKGKIFEVMDTGKLKIVAYEFTAL
jgi:hypothetical protein